MPLDDVETIAAQAREIAASLKRQIQTLMGSHRVAMRIFYGPDGKLSDAAIEWLDALGNKCFAEMSTYEADARAHAFNEGRRAVYLEIIHGLKLDQRRLAALTRQLKQEDEDDD